MQGQMNKYWDHREKMAVYNKICNGDMQAPPGFWEENPNLKNPEDPESSKS